MASPTLRGACDISLAASPRERSKWGGSGPPEPTIDRGSSSSARGRPGITATALRLAREAGSNPPADCYATAVRDWEIALDRLTAFGQRIGAITDISDPAAVSAVSQAGSDFNAADSAFLDSLDKAAASCGTSPSPSV